MDRPRPRVGGAPEIHFPNAARQIRRLQPQFRALQQAFDAQRAHLAETAQGAQPEQVLVLEIVGTVDEFVNAVRRVRGLEWLAEWDAPELAADQDFYRNVADEGTVGGRLFLIMSNQAALDELLRLWRIFRYDPHARFDYGLQRFRRVFEQLHSIRPWGVADRLAETNALTRWEQQLALGPQTMRLEADLWFRSTDVARVEAVNRFTADIEMSNGRVLLQAVIAEIRYHGVLAEVPSGSMRSLVERQEYAAWLSCNDVMVFAPVGQTIHEVPEEEPLIEGPAPPPGAPDRVPTVALFDGLPIENHVQLDGRLEVDDPDDVSPTYPVMSRIHGTSMASLIVHGDLEQPEPPLSRPVYVRPVMEPFPEWFRRRGERMSESTLPLDLIHRAVIRLFEQDAGGPVAPSVKIVNLALGDPDRVFDRALSPWARLLDWLAFRYRLIILVSAGNHGDLESGDPSNMLLDGTPLEREAYVLRAVNRNARIRRLLSPAESVNSLTIGAEHADLSQSPAPGLSFDPYITQGMPSPVGGLGLGYRRAVKPEVLFPGGRQLFLEPPRNSGPPSLVQLAEQNAQPPGVLAARPGNAPGDIRALGYTRGTSVSTALASRTAALILEEITRLRQTTEFRDLDPQLDAVLVKALLVHCSTWGPGIASLQSTLRPLAAANFREHVARFVGYGIARPDRSLSCSPDRATLVRSGWLRTDESHLYDVPLPPSLSGKADWRRLIVTLAWLTPTNPASRNYRRAVVSFVRIDHPDPLSIDRREVDARAVSRGTVQHEVFDGAEATAYADGDRVRLRVDCREDAGGLEDPVPYGIAVTLEVRPGVGIPVYEEIQQRIRPAVRIRPA